MSETLKRMLERETVRLKVMLVEKLPQKAILQQMKKIEELKRGV